jgi:hypothetical protein
MAVLFELLAQNYFLLELRDMNGLSVRDICQHGVVRARCRCALWTGLVRYVIQ